MAQPSMSTPRHGLSDQFRHYFELIPANTPELKRIVFQIRYQVYCEELAYEPPENFPDGLEQDNYDPRSLHVLLRHRPSGEYAGCVRLILQDTTEPKAEFPFEHYCGHSLKRNLIDPSRLPRDAFGEISRLAVRGQFRRRLGEQGSPHGVPNDQDEDDINAQRRIFPHIALGLYLAGAALGLMQGLSGVFVMMEPRLARHMRRYGIVFREAGDVVDYHGQRGPFYISRQDLFEYLKPEIRDLLDAITEDLDGVNRQARNAAS